MSKRLDLAKRLLIALSDEELARVEEMLPMIRSVVRSCEDEATSLGLIDLQDEGLVEAVISELDDDLDRLFGRGSSDTR